jgi:hypothetical protein
VCCLFILGWWVGADKTKVIATSTEAKVAQDSCTLGCVMKTKNHFKIMATPNFGVPTSGIYTPKLGVTIILK